MTKLLNRIDQIARIILIVIWFNAIALMLVGVDKEFIEMLVSYGMAVVTPFLIISLIKNYE